MMANCKLSVQISEVMGDSRRKSPNIFPQNEMNVFELKSRLHQFLLNKFHEYSESCRAMLMSGIFIGTDITKLKTVPDCVFADIYGDSAANFDRHVSLHKHELKQFLDGAALLNIDLRVLAADAQMLNRLISDLKRQFRDFAKYDKNAISPNGELPRTAVIGDTPVLLQLHSFSNFARRIEREFDAKKCPHLRIPQIAEDFLFDKRGLDQKTLSKYAQFINRFKQLLGENRLITEFLDEPKLGDQPLAIKFRDQLSKMKTGRRMTEKMQPSTVNQYVGFFHSLLEWARETGRVNFQKNPFSGLMLDIGVSKQVVRRQFSAPEIRSIFSYRPAHVLEARGYPDAAYWLPKIMALMLMRPSEIADLKLRDIRRQDDLIYVSLSEVDTKNHSSKRVVPVHKQLITLGFLDYIERCVRLGNVYLFEELQLVDKQDAYFGVIRT
ncbi:MAG TPA: hypothetical protein DF774_11360, partial [Rheinheimera sp.]|uniref:hypothetical protein n=1 Tax=Rheinheimera sp. TaxID=1869214 RepID=UPI000ED14EC2